jgi:hypothetical protein
MPTPPGPSFIRDALPRGASGLEEAGPDGTGHEWQGSDLCARPRPPVPPRLIAGLLLGALAGRFAFALARGSHPIGDLPWMAAALALGVCLWWVAHRQVGTAGAASALALYVSAPDTLHAGFAAIPALGLFAMLYTAVGVAHALQGPRRKWMPRILLMAAICVFTAVAQPVACAAGLVLSLAAMVYVVEKQRRILLVLFTFWIAVATSSRLLLGAFSHRLTIHFVSGGFDVGQTGWLHNAGLLLALLATLALWARARRSRYFGNTAPLLAAIALASTGLRAGSQALSWALPFALLFVAGVFADGLEIRSKRLWELEICTILAIQIVLSI